MHTLDIAFDKTGLWGPDVSGRGTLKGGPYLADRVEMADHIHKDATDRYAPYLPALL